MNDLTKLDELLAKAVDDINKCRQELHLAPEVEVRTCRRISADHIRRSPHKTC